MAQPASIQLDLSTLRSDGTSRGPGKYTQLTRQHEGYRNYLTEVSKKFNANAQLVNAYGAYTF